MSTFYLTPSPVGLPLCPVPSSQPFSLPPAAHTHSTGRTSLDALKSDGPKPSGCHPEDSKLTCNHSNNNNSSSKGRCRSPLAQPLRHRQLPASFWQEPNVPRGHPAYPHFPHPFPFPHWVVPPCSTSSSSSSSSSSDVSGASAQSGRGKQNGGQVHKEFLERLQSAQIRGYDLAASRFPITEFLFYNYGLRSYLDSSSSSASSSSADIPSILTPPHAHALPRSCSSTFRPEDLTNPRKSAAVPKTASSRGCGQPPRVPNSVCGASMGLTFPTLCPYLGYNCPHLHSGHPHRFWDCILGQAAAASLSSSSSSPLSLEEGRGGQGVGGGLWKGGGGGRSVSAYPGRFHPFAHV